MTVGQRAAETPDSRMRGCDVRVEEAQEAEEVQEVQEVEETPEITAPKPPHRFS